MKPVIVRTESWKFEKADLQRWASNMIKFASPLIALYAGFVIAQINLDGFSWSDFAPTNEVVGGLILYVLNAVYDASRKFALPQTYIVSPK